MADIDRLRKQTGWTRQMIIDLFGLTRQRLNRWVKELEEPEDIVARKIFTRILPEEMEAVIAYRTLSEECRNLGYRKFTWTLVDENIAFLSESSIYRLLKSANLLGPSFKMSDGAEKEYQYKPRHVHHHWHTDLAYVKLGIEHYYLIFMLDGYSRYILDWELMTDMTGNSVELFTQSVIDKYPEATPMIIHDNGVQFISHEFKRMLKANHCVDVPTRVKHPETNGKGERLVGLIRQEALRPNSPAYYGEAVRVIGRYVEEYNNDRYHSGIGYLKPVDVFHGRDKKILAERKIKLARARQERIDINKKRCA